MVNQKYARYSLFIVAFVLLAVAAIYAYSSLKQPFVPMYIIVWGFIGGASYVVKTVASYMGSGKFEDKYIPYHLARLVLGPALAMIVYFILKSGGVFGITLEVAGDKELYAYAVLAFASGYFVRHVIDTLSEIMDAVLKLPKDSKGTEQGQQ